MCCAVACLTPAFCQSVSDARQKSNTGSGTVSSAAIDSTVGDLAMVNRSIASYWRGDRSRFCQRSYSPRHSAVGLEITAAERFGASLPNTLDLRNQKAKGAKIAIAGG